jgi:hypothetical protein
VTTDDAEWRERTDRDLAEIANALWQDSRLVRSSPSLAERVNAHRARVRAQEEAQVAALHAKRLAARIAQDAALELATR